MTSTPQVKMVTLDVTYVYRDHVRGHSFVRDEDYLLYYMDTIHWDSKCVPIF